MMHFVENKVTGIHMEPPDSYQQLSVSPSTGRCFYCGHIPGSRSRLAGPCCPCQTCVCCQSTEASTNVVG